MGYQNENECLYEILGVRPDCTLRQIRVAYKKLALANHPDRFKTAAEKEKAHEVFARINNAHQILSDPEKREKYNAKRKFRGDSNRSSTHPNPSGASSRHEKPRPNHHHGSYSSQSSTGFSGEDKQNQDNRREPRNKKYQKAKNHYSSTSSARQESKGCNTSGSSGSNRSSSHSGDNSSTNRSWEDQNDTSHNTNSDTPIYGVNMNGQPCKRCIKKGDFCYQHEAQRHKGSSAPRKQNDRSKGSPGPSTSCGSGPFGVTKTGEPCKRCIKQCSFCYQHKYQEHHQ